MDTDKRTRADKVRIFIVDDHPIVVERLADLIDGQPDLSVCGDAQNAPDAMQRIEETRPDLAIIDISLRKSNGLDLIKALKSAHPDLAILVLSMHDESLYAERALRAGALGYVRKQEATKNILTAIRCVLEGGVYVSNSFASGVVSRLIHGNQDDPGSLIRKLSNRELEVLRLLGVGHNTREIADGLHLSVKTIEVYRGRLKEKLRLTSGAELLRFAMQWVSEQDRK